MLEMPSTLFSSLVQNSHCRCSFGAALGVIPFNLPGRVKVISSLYVEAVHLNCHSGIFLSRKLPTNDCVHMVGNGKLKPSLSKLDHWYYEYDLGDPITVVIA